jgi:dihydroorotase
MQTITVHVEESFLQTLKEFISQYPKDKISLEEDSLTLELQKRIKEIDDGKIEMIPFSKGMQALRAKMKNKYAHYPNS